MDEAKPSAFKEFCQTKRLPLLALPLAFLTGFLLLALIQFTNIKDTSVHHHANFALYINGKRDEFKSFTFYEEIQVCAISDPDNLKTRVHMHNQNPGLIHVHDHAVTWGQFFANLGYGLSDKAVSTDDGVFVTDQNGKKLSFILNGQTVNTIANSIINSEDRLLINYGSESPSALQERFQSVPSDAVEANTKPDPAACSGAHNLTFTQRLKQAFGLSSSASTHSH